MPARFTRETVPEDYDSLIRGLELGRINRLRRETPLPTSKLVELAGAFQGLPPLRPAIVAAVVALAIVLWGGG